MVTEQQLGGGNNVPSGQEDNKNSNKNGPGVRKKPGATNKLVSSSNTDAPLPDHQAALRLLAAHNPAVLQNPQMAALLKQCKGALNGTSFFLLFIFKRRLTPRDITGHTF